MNSDPYDSAAWRTFGMLDADESSIFDEAMRFDPVLHSAYFEMSRLSAAIAASTSTPVQPKAGQLERLQSRLGLSPTKRAHLWLAISGWAAAAVLALLFILKRSDSPDNSHQPSISTSTQSPQIPKPDKPLIKPASAVKTPEDNELAHETPDATHVDSEHKAIAKVETKRLVQEIEVLRENLEKFQHRDRALFEPVPGMALPIVMTMRPPPASDEEAAALAKNDERSPITAMLGDAVRAMNMAPTAHPPDATHLSEDGANPSDAANPTPDATSPSAIPIYDAARDSGTLVVSNLPPTRDGESYNLWVTTLSGGQAIYVGSLPSSSATGADSFDFSLGSTMVLPSGFLLTKDPKEKPVTPNTANTVLRGPSSYR